MLERIARGELPSKPHTVLRGSNGGLRYEECLTRSGFDGPFTILYHEHRPHEATPVSFDFGAVPLIAADDLTLKRRHYRTSDLTGDAGEPSRARIPLLFNDSLTLSVLHPRKSDTTYFVNADGDDLFYVQRGQGILKTLLGNLTFGTGDYVYVPKGLIHRFVLDESPQFYFVIECKRGLDFPHQYRNHIGQLRMDAPFSHRDFRRPVFRGPEDEGLRRLAVKRGQRLFGFEAVHNPLDVVGFDGTLYPWAFPILSFSPKVSAVHLPPSVHGTFAAPGALICSFVPRPLDFHPQAIPCPYPHSSVDVDEVIFYSDGEFASRKGVQSGSVSHHPAGIAHGPHPGNYEESLGRHATNELAVMIDCFDPLRPTPQALSVEDPDYHDSFREQRPA